MEFNLAGYTQFVVVSGSHAYGMDTPTSDLDIRGWCVPPKDFSISYFKRFEQSEQKFKATDFPWAYPLAAKTKYGRYVHPEYTEPYDCIIYNLDKFVKLAADCNPNIVELLFTNDEDIIYQTSYGSKLVANRHMFLSGRAKFSFSGYARAQLKRINTHRHWLINPPKEKPTREGFGLPVNSAISPEQKGAAESLITKQVRLWLLEEAEVDKTLISNIKDDLVEAFASILENKDIVGSLTTESQLIDAARIAAAKKLNFNENYITVLQAEKKCHDALANFNSYQSWKANRNPARAELEIKYGYDTKHASHLVRLMLQCKEILTTGNLTVKDIERAKLLKEIRAGAWTYDQLIEWTDKIEEELNAIYLSGSYLKCVPKSPDPNYIDNIYKTIVEEFWEYE